MKKFIALTIFTLALGLSSTGHADPKPWIWSWGIEHFQNQDFKPYIANAERQHSHQFSNRKAWTVEDWIAAKGGSEKLVDGFYQARVIQAQREKGNVPLLVVGPNFYRLSGYDQKRVTESLDLIYQITATHPAGMFFLEDWRSGDKIGSYTRNGLFLH